MRPPRTHNKGVTITSLEAIPVRIPFKVPYKIATADQTARPYFDVVIVRLKTDDGAEGIGETQAWRRQGSVEDVRNLVNSIREYFAPIVVGRSPFDIAAIMNDLNKVLYQSLYAQAPVGDALYDLSGKLLGVPVSTLLGGKCRESIRQLACLSMQPDAKALVDLAEWYRARGFRHFEVKIGLDAEADVRNVQAVRERLGDEVSIQVDSNGGMTFDAALRLLKKLEPFGLKFAEQPVPIWDLDGLAALTAWGGIPIMADESVSTIQSLLEVVRRRAATSLQTKIGKNGGIHYIRQLWPLAQAAGIGIMPGNHPVTSIAAAATAHLCAAWPGPLIEGCFAENTAGEQADEIVEQPIVVKNGEVFVPDGPGFGMALDEAKIKRYRLDA